MGFFCSYAKQVGTGHRSAGQHRDSAHLRVLELSEELFSCLLSTVDAGDKGAEHGQCWTQTTQCGHWDSEQVATQRGHPSFCPGLVEAFHACFDIRQWGKWAYLFTHHLWPSQEFQTRTWARGSAIFGFCTEGDLYLLLWLVLPMTSVCSVTLPRNMNWSRGL